MVSIHLTRRCLRVFLEACKVELCGARPQLRSIVGLGVAGNLAVLAIASSLAGALARLAVSGRCRLCRGGDGIRRELRQSLRRSRD
jgi:hypothetical protein